MTDRPQLSDFESSGHDTILEGSGSGGLLPLLLAILVILLVIIP